MHMWELKILVPDNLHKCDGADISSNAERSFSVSPRKNRGFMLGVQGTLLRRPIQYLCEAPGLTATFSTIEKSLDDYGCEIFLCFS